MKKHNPLYRLITLLISISFILWSPGISLAYTDTQTLAPKSTYGEAKTTEETTGGIRGIIEGEGGRGRIIPEEEIASLGSYRMFNNDGYDEDYARIISMAADKASSNIRKILEGDEVAGAPKEERVIQTLIDVLKTNGKVRSIRVLGEEAERFKGDKGDYDIVIKQENFDLVRKSNLAISTLLGVYDTEGNLVGSFNFLNGPITGLTSTNGKNNTTHYAYDGSKMVKRYSEFNLSEETNDKKSPVAVGGTYKQWPKAFQDYYRDRKWTIPGSGERSLKTRYSGVNGVPASGANMYEIMLNNGFIIELMSPEEARLWGAFAKAAKGGTMAMTSIGLVPLDQIPEEDATVQLYAGNKVVMHKLKEALGKKPIEDVEVPVRAVPRFKNPESFPPRYNPDVTLKSFLEKNIGDAEEKTDLLGAFAAIQGVTSQVANLYVKGATYTGIIDSGDAPQLTIDLQADELFANSLRPYILSYHSEEGDANYFNDGQGRHLAYIGDPLDGSSKVASIGGGGSIGALIKTTRSETLAGNTGRQIVASYFVTYGPETKLIIAHKDTGVHEFLLKDGTYYYVRQIRLPVQPSEEKPRIALGGTRKDWPAGFPELSDYWQSTLDSENGYGGAMVTDLYGVLNHILGGGQAVFAYLANKLRVRYEEDPLSFIMEQAGGADLTHDFSEERSVTMNKIATKLGSVLDRPLKDEVGGKQQKAPIALGDQYTITQMKRAMRDAKTLEDHEKGEGKTFIAVTVPGKEITPEERNEMDIQVRQVINDAFADKDAVAFGDGIVPAEKQIDNNAFAKMSEILYNIMSRAALLAGNETYNKWISRRVVFISDDNDPALLSSGSLHLIGSSGNYDWRRDGKSTGTHYVKPALVRLAFEAMSENEALEFIKTWIEHETLVLDKGKYVQPTKDTTEILNNGFSKIQEIKNKPKIDRANTLWEEITAFKTELKKRPDNLKAYKKSKAEREKENIQNIKVANLQRVYRAFIIKKKKPKEVINFRPPTAQEIEVYIARLNKKIPGSITLLEAPMSPEEDKIYSPVVKTLLSAPKASGSYAVQEKPENADLGNVGVANDTYFNEEVKPLLDDQAKDMNIVVIPGLEAALADAGARTDIILTPGRGMYRKGANTYIDEKRYNYLKTLPNGAELLKEAFEHESAHNADRDAPEEVIEARKPTLNVRAAFLDQDISETIPSEEGIATDKEIENDISIALSKKYKEYAKLKDTVSVIAINIDDVDNSVNLKSTLDELSKNENVRVILVAGRDKKDDKGNIRPAKDVLDAYIRVQNLVAGKDFHGKVTVGELEETAKTQGINIEEGLVGYAGKEFGEWAKKKGQKISALNIGLINSQTSPLAIKKTPAHKGILEVTPKKPEADQFIDMNKVVGFTQIALHLRQISGAENLTLKDLESYFTADEWSGIVTALAATQGVTNMDTNVIEFLTKPMPVTSTDVNLNNKVISFKSAILAA